MLNILRKQNAGTKWQFVNSITAVGLMVNRTMHCFVKGKLALLPTKKLKSTVPVVYKR